MMDSFMLIHSKKYVTVCFCQAQNHSSNNTVLIHTVFQMRAGCIYTLKLRIALYMYGCSHQTVCVDGGNTDLTEVWRNCLLIHSSKVFSILAV